MEHGRGDVKKALGGVDLKDLQEEEMFTEKLCNLYD